MQRSPSDLERRRRAWAALSELFLDTELQPDDFHRLARMLRGTGYSEADLERILRREVGPVLAPNLLAVAGVWTGFDLDWLEAEIRERKLSPWLWWITLPEAIRPDWERLLAALHEAGPAAGPEGA